MAGNLSELKTRVLGWLRENSVCTCSNPCCEVDIGVGYVTCGEQHCAVHGCPENQGIPSYRSYEDGSLYSRDTVQGQPVGTHTHAENRLGD